MALSRVTLTALAKSIAQDPGTGAAKLLLVDGDYDTAITLALPMFSNDRPNLRIVHYTVPAEAFRFVLLGSGVIAPLTGADAWIDGDSFMQAVWQDYDTTSDQNAPLEREFWRIRREPGPLEVLELVGTRAAAASVLRLEFTRPHEIHATVAGSSSVLAGDTTALGTLVAHHLCNMVARRYVQNTGTSSFQNESVDRRTQSDMMASRAKDLLTRYTEMVGTGGGENLAAAGIVRRLALETTHRRGRLWPH